MEYYDGDSSQEEERGKVYIGKSDRTARMRQPERVGRHFKDVEQEHVVFSLYEGKSESEDQSSSKGQTENIGWSSGEGLTENTASSANERQTKHAVRPAQEELAAQIKQLAAALDRAEAVILKAGAGLSKSAGFTESGKQFEKYFGDFAEKYGFKNMMEGSLYPFETLEEKWAYFSRLIYIHRYMKPPKAVYEQLYELIDGRNKGDLASSPRKDYFVLTTNVDHQFQKAGFAKRRMFYGQGDYGLWQCSKPCHSRTYDNKERVVKMVLAQGFSIDEDRALIVPVTESGQTDFEQLVMEIPTEMVPYCPVCGEPMSMNLRSLRTDSKMNNSFVEDEGFREAAGDYEEFLDVNEGRQILFWEIGAEDVKTPMQFSSQSLAKLAADNPLAAYACVCEGEVSVPDEIADRSIIVRGDEGEIISELHILLT